MVMVGRKKDREEEGGGVATKSTFVDLMLCYPQGLLKDIPHTRCIVYLDDLLVHAKSFESTAKVSKRYLKQTASTIPQSPASVLCAVVLSNELDNCSHQRTSVDHNPQC